MIAAVLCGPCEVQVREVGQPVTPDDGLLLRVVACGVCGSDVRRWREGPPEGCGGITPGHEVAGVVEAVGPDCSGWEVGDRLALAPDVHCGRCWYCRHGRYNLCDDLRLVGITPGYPGGMAEGMALTGRILRDGIVHEMPAGMGAIEATLAEPASSVVACHDRAGTTLGDTVLVMGAGPIGCLHAVVAAARGARVIVSEPNADRRNLAETMGPAAVLDPAAEDVIARVGELTGGLGADVAICANPVAAAQAQAVQAVRKAGRVVLFGGLPADDPTTTLDANRIHYGEIEVVGAFSYHPTAHAKALRLIHRGLIPADRLITHTFPLREVETAFRVAAGGEGLKVVVTVGAGGDRST